jgi:hypothetical protein
VKPDFSNSFPDSKVSETADAEDASPLKVVPFSAWYPVLAGVFSGILLRLVFSGAAGSARSAMAGSFIFLAPMLVGAVTVYVAETTQRRSWAYYFWAPLVANGLFVLGTLAILVEGLICAIVIVPLFACVGAVGGLAMGIVCRVTNWPKQVIYSLAALPIALGLAGDYLGSDYLPTPSVLNSVRHSVFVNAPPAQVWQHINYATNIRPEEFSATWAAKIGVPMPQSGITEMTAEGRVRRSLWDKAVHFDEPIAEWVPERYMRWTYRFDSTSFPPHALDDHVTIGGHYFDLRDTSFTLSPEMAGTRLEIQAHYRVSTQFNFYAIPVAQLLLNNMLETGLTFYKNRSELASKSLMRPG